MRVTSLTISIICASLLCAFGQNASAENETENSQIPAPYVSNAHSLYIEMINENEVILENKKISLDELEDYIRENLSDLEERHLILYITDTKYVNQAYRFRFDLNHALGKHIWVTYKPEAGTN